MKLAIGQINPVIGDIESNLQKVKSTLKSVYKEAPDILIFPELCLTGYPPKDILKYPHFIALVSDALADLQNYSKQFPDCAIIVGAPQDGFNAAIMIQNGKILGTHHKVHLPSYDVFDEHRYFKAGTASKPIAFKDHKIGLTVCEDAWKKGPCQDLAKQGATILINLSASPFEIGKDFDRFQRFQAIAEETQCHFVLVNQVGGNDDLIFDGTSLVINPKGQLLTQLNSFQEAVVTIDIDKTPPKPYHPLNRLESVEQALILGIRDYAAKCHFKTAILGLSGGIDSALTAYLATQALGSKNITGVLMPSEFSSKGSIKDAEALAKNLKIDTLTLPISDIYASFLNTLKPEEFGVMNENLQSRIRGNLLMALSNQSGALLLTTGNKSELAVGYCTLYGDMCGGIAVISDLPKTLVFELAKYINTKENHIPESSITKPPSAELRPHQKDSDTLPDYEILDAILAGTIENHMSKEDLMKENIPEETIDWVLDKLHKNEYKRQQAAPGFKITTKAFGSGRRMPIASSQYVW